MELLRKLISGRQNLQAGYSLVELLLAIGLFGVLITVLFTGFIATREGKPQQLQRMKAAALLQETVEAIRIVRESDWAIFAQNGDWHPEIDAATSTTWTLVTGEEIIVDILVFCSSIKHNVRINRP